MYEVLIIGAGSIGNHLAYSCRQKNWIVNIFDIDQTALNRTKEMIFPSRYGVWDNEIQLLSALPYGKKFDLVIIGTPPETHIEIAYKILVDFNPKIILIEKPLCPPDMNGLRDFQAKIDNSNTTVLVGYNHNLTPNTKFSEQLIKDGIIGDPLSMHVRWLEHWGGIFNAHPWLDGPQDSYLGYLKRGGGACGEHSHAISIWQHFSNFMSCGKITEVATVMKIFEQNKVKYDESAIISVKSKNGLIGSIIQDVITKPSQKLLRIQGTEGFIEWHVNYDRNHDAVISEKFGENREKKLISKTRPDDISSEIDHVGKLIYGQSKKSPISLEPGIDCMRVIAAAFESNRTGKKVIID